jgi:hypothetical protein
MITGATVRYSLPRAPAARNRDTVTPPPSTSTLPSPRPASMASTLSGVKAPSAHGSRTRSTPGGTVNPADAQPTTHSVGAVPSVNTLRSRFALPRWSSTTRTGCRPAHARTVSRGSSLRTVSTPMTTASARARSRCRCSRSASPVTNTESPVRVAMPPSRLCPSWANANREPARHSGAYNSASLPASGVSSARHRHDPSAPRTRPAAWASSAVRTPSSRAQASVPVMTAFPPVDVGTPPTRIMPVCGTVGPIRDDACMATIDRYAPWAS